MFCVATRGDLASYFAGMVFYLTNVGYRFPSTRLLYKTEQNFEVQLATCLWVGVCELKEKYRRRLL